MEIASGMVSGATAVGACAAMAFLYVGILYAPTVLLRLPPPATLESFLIRRFICAAVASLVSVVACAVLLGITSFEAVPPIFDVIGLRLEHLGAAAGLPILLTSLPYLGTLVSKLALLVIERSDQGTSTERNSRGILGGTYNVAANILTWRNYVVAPLTEEIVFRACMIPLLLCGGFKTSSVIFLSPVFFSLAHLNHFMELYLERGYNIAKAFIVVGLQLGYTVIFGWYASFLFIRTGNLIGPIVAHILCNILGLPILSSPRAKGLSQIATVIGFFSFFALLFPITNPIMYNNAVHGCKCWHRYCDWN